MFDAPVISLVCCVPAFPLSEPAQNRLDGQHNHCRQSATVKQSRLAIIRNEGYVTNLRRTNAAKSQLLD